MDLKFFEALIENTPTMAILLYIVWRQQRLINLVIAACVKHLNEEEHEE